MEFTPVDKIRYKFLLLQTFKAFVKFCKDNGIQFFAAGGTMIGAVRHRGFIPWDDDIDVYMKRCDYDKFINLRSQLDGTNYEILDPSLDGYYCAHTKFSHRYSTLWEFQGIPFVFGAYVDVFVLDFEDGSYEDVAKRRMEYAKKTNYLFISANNHPNKEIKKLFLHGCFKKSLWYVFQKLILKNYHSILKKQLIRHLKNNQGEWLVAYTGTSGEKDIFRSDWFEGSISFPFEDTFVDVPSGYDEFLTAMYGDYMTPPSIEDQISHHVLFYYDLNRRITKDEIEQMQIEDR